MSVDTPVPAGTRFGTETVGDSQVPWNIILDANGNNAVIVLLAALNTIATGIATLDSGDASSANQATEIAALNALGTLLSGQAPADNFKAITPNDSTALTTVPKALFIGVAGNLTVKGGDGISALFPVQAGQILPIRARFVMATGTTATGIVAIS